MPKPTGIAGPVAAHVDEQGNLSGGFERITFPTNKDDVEEFFASRFIADVNGELAKKSSYFMDGLERNKENDFDFTVRRPAGLAYLELMESAPLKGPYEHAPNGYDPYEYAQYILSEVRKKSVRYPKSQVRDIYLLIYITHWKFVLSDSVRKCLMYWLAREKSAFKQIWTYSLFTEESGTPHKVFPVYERDLGSFNPESVKGGYCLNLDPAQAEVRWGNDP